MLKKVFLTLVVLFAFGAVSAFASDFLADYFKNKVSVQRAVELEVCMAVWHDGSDTEAGTAVTSAWFSTYVDVACTLHINGALDTRVSTDGIIAVGTENTFGKVADAINAAKGWHCQLVDMLRADVPTHIHTKTVSDAYKTAVTINRGSNDDACMGVGLVRYGYGKEDLTGWQVFVDAIIVDPVFADGAKYIEVYICDDIAKTETSVLRFEGPATTVEQWYPTYGPNGVPIIAAPPGQRIVVKMTCTASDPDALTTMGVMGSIVKVH